MDVDVNVASAICWGWNKIPIKAGCVGSVTVSTGLPELGVETCKFPKKN